MHVSGLKRAAVSLTVLTCSKSQLCVFDRWARRLAFGKEVATPLISMSHDAQAKMHSLSLWLHLGQTESPTAKRQPHFQENCTAAPTRLDFAW